MSRSKTIFANKYGFLLLEVLVSITIISVGLVYIARSFSSSSRAIETSARFLKSVALAEERLWDIEAKGVIDTGSDKGHFDRDRSYTWALEAKELGDAPLNTVALWIEWSEPARKQRVTLETYMWNEEE